MCHCGFGYCVDPVRSTDPLPTGRHMVVRINKMLSCAGADRLQTGLLSPRNPLFDRIEAGSDSALLFQECVQGTRRLLQPHVFVCAMPAAIRVAAAGMCGAFGKPYGKVARVGIGQVLLSMRCREDKTESAQEALR